MTDVQTQICMAVCPTSSSAFLFPSTRSRNEIAFSLGHSPQSHLVIKKLAISLDVHLSKHHFGCCNCYPPPPPPPKREKFNSNISSLQLVCNWVSMSCQLDRVTSGQSSDSPHPPPHPQIVTKMMQFICYVLSFKVLTQAWFKLK